MCRQVWKGAFMRYTFPKDFMWGVATAAAQLEGAAFEGITFIRLYNCMDSYQ